MNRNTIILVVILVVLAAVGYMVYQKKTVQAPANDGAYTAPVSDSPDSIDRDLDAIDTGANLDADFQSTDKDIQAL